MKSKTGISRNLFLTILIVALSPTLSMAEFQFPLKALSPRTAPLGEWHIRIGADYNQGERLFFQDEDKDRKLYSLPTVNAAFGVSPNVELLLSYPVLYLKQEAQSGKYGSGDLRICTVFNLLPEKDCFPESALKLEVKLPNADDVDEFGTDQTDVFIGGAFSKKLWKLDLLVNADLGIMGNPQSLETTQDDVLLYKIGTLYPVSENYSVGLELDGIALSRFGNDRQFIRVGLSMRSQMCVIDAGVAAGLNNASGDYQVGVGVTLNFG